VLRELVLLSLELVRFLFSDGEGDLSQRATRAHLHLLAAHDGLRHVRRFLLLGLFVGHAVDHRIVEALRLLGGGLGTVLLLPQTRIDQTHLREAGRGLFFGLDLAPLLRLDLVLLALLLRRLLLPAHPIHYFRFFYPLSTSPQRFFGLRGLLALELAFVELRQLSPPLRSFPHLPQLRVDLGDGLLQF